MASSSARSVGGQSMSVAVGWWGASFNSLDQSEGRTGSESSRNSRQKSDASSAGVNSLSFAGGNSSGLYPPRSRS